jgi:hypothetical protein
MMAENFESPPGSEWDLDIFPSIPITVRGSLMLFARNSFRGS